MPSSHFLCLIFSRGRRSRHPIKESTPDRRSVIEFTIGHLDPTSDQVWTNRPRHLQLREEGFCMPFTRHVQKVSLIIPIFIMLALVPENTFAQSSELGKVDFPTTGSAPAQVHFLRGVAALHSFWFEEAFDEFKEATRLDPDFMMGYWGEAMTYNHPLWAQQDTESARQVLTKIKDLPTLTARERAFIAAIRVLYGEGDKLTRDLAYCSAMEKIYKAYPNDLEA